MQAEWFKDWFNSPYYHILYKNRDDSEAAKLIDALIKHLKLQKDDIIWDLACGMGRHSVYLNKKGFRVIGTDLSENSIQQAVQHSNATLDFYVHDMRTPFRMNYFTHVFNLFTSIGYFDNFNDNAKVFKNVYSALKPTGVFVVDFLNTNMVQSCLPYSDKKTIEGITFNITKRAEKKHIIKKIEFSDKGKDYYFEEKVSLLSRSDFETIAKSAGFKIESVFGDYDLKPFDISKSDRLILIFKK
jgi:ubiquinone/menaquinone biosynthesis C-methylase UbiE